MPAVRAAFGRMVQQRFGLVLVEHRHQGAEVYAVERNISPEGFEEAQAQVPFPIPLPTLLPEGFELWAIRVGSGAHGDSIDEQGNLITMTHPIQVILQFKPNESSKSKYRPNATIGLDIMDQIGLQGGYAAPTFHVSRAKRPEISKSRRQSRSRRWGNKSTSRIVTLSVNNIARRSTPVPKPPVGGIP